MQYVLHKSWCDYTFSNHYSFFTGTLEHVSIKQQEYTAIFQEVLKSLVCQQVMAIIQFYTQLLQSNSQSTMSENILTILSIFNLTYQEELAKLTSANITDNEKIIQATTSAYLSCFYDGYELPSHFNQFLNFFLSIKENQICSYIPYGTELPLNSDCDSLITPRITLANLIPNFETDYPYYWNDLPMLRNIALLDTSESDSIKALINEYRTTVSAQMQTLEQQYGVDHSIFNYAFWETDATFSICSQQEWDEISVRD